MEPGEPPGGLDELRLNPGVVEDDELLAATVDAFIEKEAAAAEIQAEAGRLNGDLHDVVDGHFLPIWFRAEELTTARWSELALRLARWAFAEGRRFPICAELDESRGTTGP